MTDEKFPSVSAAGSQVVRLAVTELCTGATITVLHSSFLWHTCQTVWSQVVHYPCMNGQSCFVVHGIPPPKKRKLVISFTYIASLLFFCEQIPHGVVNCLLVACSNKDEQFCTCRKFHALQHASVPLHCVARICVTKWLVKYCNSCGVLCCILKSSFWSDKKIFAFLICQDLCFSKVW